MDLGNILKELGAKSSLLWGVAVGSLCVWLVDRFAPLGIPPEWRWVVPVTVIGSWAILLTGLVPIWGPAGKKKWTARGEKKRKDEYALKNLETAGGFERAVLVHYKSKGQQRFRARRDAQAFHEMVKHGFLAYDPFSNAYMLHYRIADGVWKFLDDPPKGWDQGKRLTEINWE